MAEIKKMTDWELQPEEYLTDSSGNFILKKDGTPRKKAGRRKGGQYNHHSETKAKIAARRALARKKKEVTRLENKLTNKRKVVKTQQEVSDKLDQKLGVTVLKPAIVSEADLDVLPEATKEYLASGQADIAFKAHPGPQTDFLSADEQDVLYGGAAGGGKSYAMLVDPLRYIQEHDHRALILRKTLGELGELIDKSRELYPKAFPGCQYKEAKKLWEFPSGAKILFGFLERDSDVYQYVGQAYSWIGFDELTHLPTSFAWDFLRSRLRTVNPKIKCYMRATTNPGGPGHAWVKQRYVEPAEPGTTFWEETMDSDGELHRMSRKFIPARLSDNPSLARGGQYKSMLASMNPIQRKRLLDGDWDIIEGAAFPEFDSGLHVIPPMDIPSQWERFKCIDYGYRAPSCCLWIAVDPSDATLFVYRELYEKGLTGEQLAERLHDMELGENGNIRGVLDGSSWSQHGQTGPTVGETLQRAGHKLRRADKNRIAGKIQVHERLKLNPKSGRPKILFFNTCVSTIRELIGIPLDQNNKEDVDTTADDHAYDALRYGVMSRPRIEDPFMRMMRFKSAEYVPFDAEFGA